MVTTESNTKRLFSPVSFRSLPLGDQKLLRVAQKVLDEAYNPYSHFFVAAAVRTSGGKLVTGTNIENAAYGASICAERTTFSTAHNLGFGNKCVAIAVVARAGEQPTTKVTAPCGECRQVMAEYAFRSGVKENFRVLLATTNLKEVVVTTLGDLLPLAFTPADLL